MNFCGNQVERIDQFYRAIWILICLYTLWSVVVWIGGRLLLHYSSVTMLFLYVPTPLLALWFLFAALVSAGCRWKKTTFLHLLLLLLFSVYSWQVENDWKEKGADKKGGGLVAINWNIGRGKWGWEGVLKKIKSLNGDLYLINEFPHRRGAGETSKALDKRYIVKKFSNFAILVRGEIKKIEHHHLPSGRLYSLHLTLRGRPFHLLAVDLSSNPFANKGEILEAIHQVMVREAPHLVMGDFNTPREAWQIHSPPGGFRHAYLQAGKGWSYTWPVAFPFVSIDHCLTSEKISVLDYELVSNPHSDHRLQILRFQFSK